MICLLMIGHVPLVPIWTNNRKNGTNHIIVTFAVVQPKDEMAQFAGGCVMTKN